MKITKISLFQYDWVAAEDENLAISKGRSFDTIPCHVLKMETDEGITGWSECNTYGDVYLEMFSDAIHPGMNKLAPHVLGMDPRSIEEVYYTMDKYLLGQRYIKAGIDIACWDILGKSLDKPVYELMGGKQTAKPRIISFLHRDFDVWDEKIRFELDCYKQAGCTRHQTKAGKGPEAAIEYLEYVSKIFDKTDSMWFDVNRGWTVSQAQKVANAAKSLGVGLIFEQPCETYEQCRDVMNTTGIPVIMDECIITMSQLTRAAKEGMGGLSIKVGRVGGLTKAKQMRDFCVSEGIEVDIQSTIGNTIADSYIAHLGTSTPSDVLGYVYSGQVVSSTRLAEDGSQPKHSSINPGPEWFLEASDKPGLGVTPDESQLRLLQSWE